MGNSSSGSGAFSGTTGLIPGTTPSPGTQLFQRSSVVTVGQTAITNIDQEVVGLDVWFEIKRSLRPKEPNTCDIKIYNLTDQTSNAISQYVPPVPSPGTVGGQVPQGVPVNIVAGYVGASSQIFLGLLRDAQTMTKGPDTWLEVSSGDADKAHAIARSNTNFGKGSSALVVATQLLTDLGLGNGNLATVRQQLLQPLYSEGVTVKGSTVDLMVDLCASCGLEFTLQGGVPQFTPLGQPLGGQAYLLSSSSGLINSPSVDSKGILHCETLMLAGLAPGMPIVMSSKNVTGPYRILSMVTKGDTAGEDWGHTLECARFGVAPT